MVRDVCDAGPAPLREPIDPENSARRTASSTLAIRERVTVPTGRAVSDTTRYVLVSALLSGLTADFQAEAGVAFPSGVGQETGLGATGGVALLDVLAAAPVGAATFTAGGALGAPQPAMAMRVTRRGRAAQDRREGIPRV